MVATLTSRHRRLLAAVVIVLGCAGIPRTARAVIPPPMITAMKFTTTTPALAQLPGASPTNQTFWPTVKPPVYPAEQTPPSGVTPFTPGPPPKFSPEPASLITGLVGSALAGLGCLGWRRRQARKERADIADGVESGDPDEDLDTAPAFV